MEFTSVDLVGGAKLAAPMEKASIGPMEKAMVGPCAGETRGKLEAWWRGRKTGYAALECRRDGE